MMAVNKTLFKERLKNCLNWRNTSLDQLLEPLAQYLRRMDAKVMFFLCWKWWEILQNKPSYQRIEHGF